MFKLQFKEDDYIHYITKSTKAHNFDNISRTKAYEKFYFKYPEIKWALVASIVSRNAGWNMTDLRLPPYEQMLSHVEQMRLFLTYERANWLIFSDAYPQLLTYQMSVQLNKPCFHLLKYFNVSTFMIDEWIYFWQTNDQNRLMISLIINEQNVIQQPIINNDYYKYHIFFRLPYLLQDFFLVNAIIIPTKAGQLYGQFVHDFTKISKRITLGKEIATIIFKPHIYQDLIDFIMTTETTGSRFEYEQYLSINIPYSRPLRLLYQIHNHTPINQSDWSRQTKVKKAWHKQVVLGDDIEIGKSFYKKRYLFYTYFYIRKMFDNDIYS